MLAQLYAKSTCEAFAPIFFGDPLLKCRGFDTTSASAVCRTPREAAVMTRLQQISVILNSSAKNSRPHAEERRSAQEETQLARSHARCDALRRQDPMEI